MKNCPICNSILRKITHQFSFSCPGESTINKIRHKYFIHSLPPFTKRYLFYFDNKCTLRICVRENKSYIKYMENNITILEKNISKSLSCEESLSYRERFLNLRSFI